MTPPSGSPGKCYMKVRGLRFHLLLKPLKNDDEGLTFNHVDNTTVIHMFIVRMLTFFFS